ncbi:MAG: hypothetical protein R3Y68_10520 [Rikenellaceae bacterium]
MGLYDSYVSAEAWSVDESASVELAAGTYSVSVKAYNNTIYANTATAYFQLLIID